MSQHDLEWADQLFPPMRVDMNQALIAISTRQAGDGPPALVAAARPNRLYVDVVRKQVLVRDNADSADFIWDSWGQDRCRLITVGPDAFLPEDVGRMLIVNSPTPVAISLPQATGLFGPGWNSEVFNIGVGEVSVVPTTSLINGAAFITLKSYQGLKAFSLGGQFWAALTGKGNATVDDFAGIIPTGTLFPNLHWGLNPPGYVRLIGNTIGDATSGATERANADTSALYTMIWSLYAQAQAPVTGGRGATAAADFAAHKPLRLFDTYGRTVFAIDGGTGRLNSGLTGGILAATPGAVGGEPYHYPILAEQVPFPHTHLDGMQVTGTGAGGRLQAGSGYDFGNYGNTATGLPREGGPASQPFNVTPPGIALGCWIAKL